MPRFSANCNGNREEHKVLAHNTHANRHAMRLSYRMANASRNMQIAVEIVRNTRFLPTITHMQTDMHYANNIGHLW